MNRKKIVQAAIGVTAVVAAGVSLIALAPSSVYVSTTGSDSNSCAQSAPCKTISKGIAVAQAGDTVMVSSGVYREYVNVNKSITLQANGLVVIDGANLPAQNGGGIINIPATVTGATVQGFEIMNGSE